MEYVQERIATLHAYGDPTPPLPADVVVVVPLMAGPLSGPTRTTFEHLETVEAESVVVPIRGDAEAMTRTTRWLTELDVPVDPLWCNAPAAESALAAAGIDHPAGKGLDVWLGLGYAAERGRHVIVHDADNASYTPAHVPRLAWPLANGFSLVKGYYARVEAGRLYGRLTRLLCLPLIETARRLTDHELLEYLGAFRYPLAGEYAVTSELATQLRLPSTWGLELGMLIDCFHRVGFDATAQVDLGWHHHDHRPVEGAGGLVEMAEQVIDAFIAGLRSDGVELDRQALEERYPIVAAEYVDRYGADAAFNGLEHRRADETRQVARYAELIDRSVDDVRLPPFETVPLDPGDLRHAGECEPLR